MMKSSPLFLGLAVLLLLPAAVTAQDNAAATAVTEAVKRQHDTIVLRQKIADARATAARKDTAGAAKLYQEAVSLAQEIGTGIDAETKQAVSGLVTASLALAEDAQSRHDYGDAATRVQQALKADPKNQVAIEFKRQNDALMEASRGKQPSPAVTEQSPAIQNQKKQAAQCVQDGRWFYENGRLDDADKKLTEAVKLDPDNAGAYYYQLLVKQARYKREAAQHGESLQTMMTDVEKRWVVPNTSGAILPSTVELPKFGNA